MFLCGPKDNSGAWFEEEVDQLYRPVGDEEQRRTEDSQEEEE